VIINAGSLWKEAKEHKSEDYDSVKVQILRYYIEARIRYEEELQFEEGLEDWIEILYNIDGRCFENCWLELFSFVATGNTPLQKQISETYDFLLDDFSLHDREKLE
jgi:hypothetical protein